MATKAIKEKLTAKEALTLKLYTDPKSKTFGNATQSAKIAYPNQTYDALRTTASRVLAKANIKLTDLMDKKGLSDGKLVEKFVEWIDAKKIKTSLTEPDRIVDDYTTQLKAVDMIIKLKGLSNTADTPTPGKGRKVTVEEWING